MRIPDAVLNEVSIESARRRYAKEHARWDIVKFSMLVNAHAHGFWMGARHGESRVGKMPGRLARLFSRKSGSDDAPLASGYYIKKTYPSISNEDRALVSGAFEAAFPLGYHYGEKHGKKD